MRARRPCAGRCFRGAAAGVGLTGDSEALGVGVADGLSCDSAGERDAAGECDAAGGAGAADSGFSELQPTAKAAVRVTASRDVSVARDTRQL